MVAVTLSLSVLRNVASAARPSRRNSTRRYIGTLAAKFPIFTTAARKNSKRVHNDISKSRTLKRNFALLSKKPVCRRIGRRIGEHG
jgi:hypothetical protein